MDHGFGGTLRVSVVDLCSLKTYHLLVLGRDFLHLGVHRYSPYLGYISCGSLYSSGETFFLTFLDILPTFNLVVLRNAMLLIQNTRCIKQSYPLMWYLRDQNRRTWMWQWCHLLIFLHLTGGVILTICDVLPGRGLLSYDEEVECHRFLRGGELLSTFITSRFLGIPFRWLPRWLSGSVFIDFLCSNHGPCSLSSEFALCANSSEDTY